MHKDRTVLVIDDEPLVATLLKRVFGDTRYRVIEANGGAAGLELLRKDGLPDAVILDLEMPGMDGVRVLHSIRAVYRTLPVIVFSAFFDDGIATLLKRAGADACVLKTEFARLPAELDRACALMAPPARKLVVISRGGEPERTVFKQVGAKIGGLSVELVPPGDDANAVLDGQPDVVLLDWEAADGLGSSLLRDLTRSHPGPNVLVATSQTPQTAFAEVLSRGAFAVLAKPFAVAEVAASLRYALDASTARHATAQHSPEPAGPLSSAAAVVGRVMKSGAAESLSVAETVARRRKALADDLSLAAANAAAEPRSADAPMSTRMRIRKALEDAERAGAPTADAAWPEALHLDCSYPTGAAVVGATLGRPEQMLFFCPLGDGHEMLPVLKAGTRVDATVRLLERAMTFRCRARVFGCETDAAVPGVYLRLLDGEEACWRKLAAAARGEPVDYVVRRHERYPCFLPVRMLQGDGVEFAGVASDMSLGGLRVGALEARLTPGMRLDIEMSGIPGAPPCVAAGRVVYVARGTWPQLAGITFDSAVAVDELALARLASEPPKSGP